MPHDAKKYLSEMLDRASFVRQFMADKSLNDLVNDRPTRSAVERELMVFGEALYELHRRHPSIAEQIPPWRKIIGFRHVLVHGYSSLKMHVVWDVVQDDLEPLIAQIQALLTESGE